MVQIVSTKQSEYNDFFSEVISALDEQYKKTPKLLIFGIPDQEDNELHMSTYGMDSFDLFQVASAVQHEATRMLVMEEHIKLENGEYDTFDDYEEEGCEPDDEETDI